MKQGDRVKHKDGRKGQILGLGARRPSPAEDPDWNTRITHWEVKWEETGVPGLAREEDLSPLQFEAADLERLKRKYPTGRHAEDEYTIEVQGGRITFTSTGPNRVHIAYLSEGGSSMSDENEFDLEEAFEEARQLPTRPRP